jgi:hypothetical protein
MLWKVVMATTLDRFIPWFGNNIGTRQLCSLKKQYLGKTGNARMKRKRKTQGWNKTAERSD